MTTALTGAASAVVLGLLLATAYAAAFHLLTGGGVRRLLLYVLAAFGGFAAGHFIGSMLSIELYKLGTLNLLAASIGAWAMLFLARFLAGR